MPLQRNQLGGSFSRRAERASRRPLRPQAFQACSLSAYRVFHPLGGFLPCRTLLVCFAQLALLGFALQSFSLGCSAAVSSRAAALLASSHEATDFRALFHNRVRRCLAYVSAASGPRCSLGVHSLQGMRASPGRRLHGSTSPLSRRDDGTRRHHVTLDFLLEPPKQSFGRSRDIPQSLSCETFGAPSRATPTLMGFLAAEHAWARRFGFGHDRWLIEIGRAHV